MKLRRSPRATERTWRRYITLRHQTASAPLYSIDYSIISLPPQPLMREVLEKKPVLTREEARDLIERCMKILYYRDARSFNRVSPEPPPSC